MAAPIITLVKQALKKPNLLKALGKYTGRQILRRTGVFGVYGTFKRFLKQNLTKPQLLKAITGSIIKKNLLRALGPMNYMVDIFKKKGGVKYALKQFGWQRMTPMAIKKVYYLYQNYQSMYGTKNPIMKEAKKEIWKQLALRNSKHTYLWKLEQIEGIMNAEDVPKRYRKELLDKWFYFKVKSPCGSFNKHSYRWHPVTGELHAYVVSADRHGRPHKGAGPKEYVAHGVSIQLIKKSIKTSSYGRMVYWVDYKHRTKK